MEYGWGYFGFLKVTMLKSNITIDQCIIKIIFEQPLSRLVRSKDLRGAIANVNKNNLLFHQHKEDGTFVYNYPLIQYKIIERKGLLVGIDKGARVIASVNLLNKRMNIGKEEYIVQRQEMSFQKSAMVLLDGIREYNFLSMWLALNEKNYEKYQRLGTQSERKRLLEKILVGNIISMSKGLGYTVSAPIEANILKIKEVQTSLKGNPMLGFLGTFSANFEIPDYWGIGKSVSRGFGTIKRANLKRERASLSY